MKLPHLTRERPEVPSPMDSLSEELNQHLDRFRLLMWSLSMLSNDLEDDDADRLWAIIDRYYEGRDR